MQYGSMDISPCIRGMSLGQPAGLLVNLQLGPIFQVAPMDFYPVGDPL